MKKFFIISFLIMSLTSCASHYDITDIENMESKGNVFDKTLKNEYIELAKVAEEKSDWDNVKIFLRRAKWASKGESPSVEPFGAREIMDNYKQIIEDYYKRVDTAFSHGAKIKSQTDSAYIQGGYECLTYATSIEKLEFDEALFKNCNDKFLNSIKFFEGKGKEEPTLNQENAFLEQNKIELKNVKGEDKNIVELLEERVAVKNGEEVKVEAKSETTNITEEIEISRTSVVLNPSNNNDKAVTSSLKEVNEPSFLKQDDTYIIYFKFNSASIPKKATNFIDEIANDYKVNNPESLTVYGYTDSKGSERINDIFSKRRAKVVARALEKKGVAKDKMIVKGMGEKGQAVKTKDEVIEPKNRRTEVKFY